MQAIQPKFAEFLAEDYKRWAKGESRDEAVGSFVPHPAAKNNKTVRDFDGGDGGEAGGEAGGGASGGRVDGVKDGSDKVDKGKGTGKAGDAAAGAAVVEV